MDRIVHIERELKGPLRIMKKELNGQVEIVAIHTVTGSLTPLASRRYVAELPDHAGRERGAPCPSAADDPESPGAPPPPVGRYARA